MANLGIEIKRKCRICGKVFIIKTLDSLYCCKKCSDVAYAWVRLRWTFHTMLNYCLTIMEYDHGKIMLTLKKCQNWQKFNVGVILLANTSNISNMSNTLLNLLKTQIKK